MATDGDVEESQQHGEAPESQQQEQGSLAATEHLGKTSIGRRIANSGETGRTERVRQRERDDERDDAR